MFKWICLSVAVVFLVVAGWMINDIRLEVRRSSGTIRATAQTVNEHLPAIVHQTKKAAETLAQHLPAIIHKTRTVTDTVAELAGDIRQVRELLALPRTERDKTLVAYATSLLNTVEKSGGTIGLNKKLGGKGLKNPAPANEWVAGARREALVLTALVRSKKEMATRLCKNLLGSSWYIQVGAGEPVRLLDWLKANHPATREVFKEGG
jgi:hypothetical protein